MISFFQYTLFSSQKRTMTYNLKNWKYATGKHCINITNYESYVIMQNVTSEKVTIFIKNLFWTENTDIQYAAKINVNYKLKIFIQSILHRNAN